MKLDVVGPSELGNGKVVVTPRQEAIRIRTGEWGEIAL